jgi:hypothetical protein
MNKTDQQKNNKYINYWTESGKSAKEANQSIKIAKTITYKDKSGKIRSITTYHHPTLKEITLSKPHIKDYSLTKEQKEERFNNAPFSEYHNKLINLTYSKENKIAKQQAQIAAHNSKIDSIICKTRARKLATARIRRENCPNILIIRREDSKGLPYDFSCNPSRKSLEELRRDALEMLPIFSKSMKDFFSIEIWEASEYANKYNRGNYRYCLFRDKEQRLNAA